MDYGRWFRVNILLDSCQMVILPNTSCSTVYGRQPRHKSVLWPSCILVVLLYQLSISTSPHPCKQSIRRLAWANPESASLVPHLLSAGGGIATWPVLLWSASTQRFHQSYPLLSLQGCLTWHLPYGTHSAFNQFSAQITALPVTLSWKCFLTTHSNAAPVWCQVNVLLVASTSH